MEMPYESIADNHSNSKAGVYADAAAEHDTQNRDCTPEDPVFGLV